MHVICSRDIYEYIEKVDICSSYTYTRKGRKDILCSYKAINIMFTKFDVHFINLDIRIILNSDVQIHNSDIESI